MPTADDVSSDAAGRGSAGMGALTGRHVPLALTGRRNEREMLDQLVDDVRAGGSRVLVLRGEPGIGKSALLEYIVTRAVGFCVVRAAGVHSEMELAFAGLHQLLVPVLHLVERLPVPQRDALNTAFGASSGSVPDHFFLGLAVLTLLSDAAEEHPLLCVVDDHQWLDHASARVLEFVGRRLEAEGVGLVFATRASCDAPAHVSELVVEGLPEADARLLLDSVLTAPVDVRVRDQIVAETRGNPLALLELPRGVTPAALAGGFAFPSAVPLSGRIEETFARRVGALPLETRRLLQLAAGDPVGEPALLWRAAEKLEIGRHAARPAIEAGLVDVGVRVTFRHPLVRSAAYRSASLRERQEMHRALADVTDPEIDPDRRAWHRAQASPGPNEDVALELEQSAGRAQARGGLAAAAAFRERAAMLTPDAALRAERTLAAAWTKREAGALDDALGLLVAVDAGPPDALRSAQVTQLRGQIAFDQRRVGDAVRMLLDAARRFGPLDTGLARETYLSALGSALWLRETEAGGGGPGVARAARVGPRAPQPPRAVDVLLDAFAIRLTEGHTVALPELIRTVQQFLGLDLDDDNDRDAWSTGGQPVVMAALELWDADAWHALASRQVRFARDEGALVLLQFALNLLAWTHLLAGELVTAAQLIEEDHLIAEATGNPPIAYMGLMLAAWRGREPEASEAISVGLGTVNHFATSARALLSNSQGRYEEARDAAWEAFQRDQIGYGPFVVPELAEAASRTGDLDLVRASLDWLSERTRATPTDWLLGIEARVRALLSQGDDADARYRESVEHLDRSRIRVEVARGHLLYGEWLRREHRRVDARTQLRIAHELFTSMGAEAFADRAGRELLATGERVRKRTVETRDDLTAQEAQIAQLARDGLSNPEIGVRLFISPRTVQYHLRKVFTKLDITSRNQLDGVLPRARASDRPH